MCGELDGLKVPLGVGGTHINFGSYRTECLERLLPYAPLSANLSMAFSGVSFLNDVLSFFISAYTLTKASPKCMDEWQLKTKLKLEKAVYDRMIIRDVNNYIAIYEDGTLKTKGAYSHDLPHIL
jgi:hypothetical protein